MRIIVASGNRNKVRELQSVATEFSVTIADTGEFGAPPDVDETGITYRQNALLKARAYSKWSGLPALGDDSGLEVSALGFRPGLYSARYGGAGLDDERRYERLLAELQQHESKTGRRDRRAWFCCALALVLPTGETFFGDSRLEGEVLDSPRGQGGFGYDPIIFLPSVGSTLAEVDFAVTCKKGFRAEAARQLFSRLIQAQGSS